MTDSNEQETKRPLSLSRPGGRLELKKPIESGSGQVRQSFPHGRSKSVQVEVKKKRTVEPPRAGNAPGQALPTAEAPEPTPVEAAPAPTSATSAVSPARVVSAPSTPVAEAAPKAEQRPDAPAAEAPAAAPAVEDAPKSAAAQAEPTVAATPAPVEASSNQDKPAPAADTETEAAATVPSQSQNLAKAPAAESSTPAEATPARPAVPASTGPRMVAPPPPPGAKIPGRPAARPARPPSTNSQSTLRRGSGNQSGGKSMTDEEKARRLKALQGMVQGEAQRRQAEVEASRRARELESERQRDEEERRRRVEEAAAAETRRKADEELRRQQDEEAKKRKIADDARREMAERAGKNAAAKVATLAATGKIKAAEPEVDEAPKRGGPSGAPGRSDPRKTAAPARPSGAKADQRRRPGGKLTVSRALSGDEGDRVRSLASVRRARERERLRGMQQQEQNKIVRDVVVPETITVQELAQRMAERGTDVIKSLMRNGIMATLNQAIDADTAELIVNEFGHNVKRVAEADVEIGLKGEEDVDVERLPRPPVVTIMGHVDHGKTSLLDALRQTDVVAGEAGGITQHIGAYQVTLATGQKITFIDTPGHQAFTAMRARGANVTDIVVLVVAADDGIKEQTVEAIRHAKAANAPIIVAINKIDKPGADPDRVRQELLQHEIVVESMGGDVLDVEVSAKQKLNLTRLEEAILLQAEILDLRANPERAAEGVIIEAKLERGRGAVATVLIQRGTLRVGDIFVAGGEWGRVRALLDDHGKNVKEALPGAPVEVLGLNGAPLAGDDFSVVENEGRARDVTDFRQRRKREAQQVAGARGTLEEMFSAIASGTAKELPVVVKSDVQGSLEAILASLRGLGTDEVAVRVLHSGVGGINESDINLAGASKAIVIGFNVRANPQARDLARRDAVDIRYYSIIYDVIDDMKQMLEGMLAPTLRENFLGNAQIREVFDITKVGKVAGCMITEGMVKRGAKVRLLRNDVVIHEGALKTLKRFKDEVKEVREGYECGMAFENYSDIQVGDVIECFEIEEITRHL